MNWKSFLEDGKWVVYQVDELGNKTSSAIGAYDSKLEADQRVKQEYLVVIDDLVLVDEQGGHGPTLLAVAATNEPFIGLKNHPAEIVQVNDTPHVRVPFLLQGFYFHPWWGGLNFNQAYVNTMIRNHVMGISEMPVYYRVNHMSGPSVAFLDIDRGGWLQEEEIDGDKLVVAYGPVVEENRARETVRDFICASMDIDDNYVPARIAKFSKPRKKHIFTINKDWLYQQEAPVKKVKVVIGGQTYEVSVDDDGLYLLDKDTVDALVAIPAAEPNDELQDQLDQATTELEAARTQVQQLAARVAELTPDDTPDVPEEYKNRLLELERRAQEAEKRELQTAIQGVVNATKSYRDERGHGHSQVFVDWIGNVLAGKPVGSGTDVAKLSAGPDAHAWRKYFMAATMWLAANMDATVPMSGAGDTGDDDNPLAKNGRQAQSDEQELAQVAAQGVKMFAKRNRIPFKIPQKQEGGNS